MLHPQAPSHFVCGIAPPHPPSPPGGLRGCCQALQRTNIVGTTVAEAVEVGALVAHQERGRGPELQTTNPEPCYSVLPAVHSTGSAAWFVMGCWPAHVHSSAQMLDLCCLAWKVNARHQQEQAWNHGSPDSMKEVLRSR